MKWTFFWNIGFGSLNLNAKLMVERTHMCKVCLSYMCMKKLLSIKSGLAHADSNVILQLTPKRYDNFEREKT